MSAMHDGCTRTNLKRRVGVPRELGAAGPAADCSGRFRRSAPVRLVRKPHARTRADARAAYECSSRANRLTTSGWRSVAAATVDNAGARAAGRADSRAGRACCQAGRTERASCQTETENRLVARSLEARWKARLIAPAEAERPAALRARHCRPVPGGL